MTGNPPEKGYRFGWFKGVYTPSVLTIFGVVMYLRFGWVLGNVGLTQTIMMVLIANLITFLTALSLSSLATNMKVSGGGAYFMISRSLGLEPGAAIGLPLFLAQALGVSFYIAGFAEAVTNIFPALPPVGVGVGTLLLLAFLAYTSADLALKSQFIIMAVIGLSLISFFAGSRVPPADPEQITQIPASLGFWAVFAVFFPAVTGIEAGISMSGDLKNPAKALPAGTIAAVISGFLVYLAIPVFLASRVSDNALLLTESMIMRDVARYGNLVVLGVWGASLSSAMGALLGAPRTLQALARDGVAPRFLGKGFGSGNDPRIATALVFLIALVGVLAGDLNLIAPVLSMFFLTSYGFLNFSAGMETLIGSPSWRPQFRVWWILSILGSVLCAAAMLMINAGASMIAALVCGSIYFLVKRRRVKARWGDMRSGILMLLARYALYKLAEKEPDERSWKPNLLVLSGPPTQRWHLVDLARSISGDSSLMTVAMVMPEEYSDQKILAAQELLQRHLQRQMIPAMVKTVTARDPFEGGRNLIRTYGFGPLVPNTILLGETRDESRLVEYAGLVLQARSRNRNVVIVREPGADQDRPSDNRIDVWWRGRGSNAGFMLALAHLIRKCPDWKGADLRINMVAGSEAERKGMELHLAEFVRNSRLNAGVRLIISSGRTPMEMIRSSSTDAKLVIMGLRLPDPEESAESYSNYYRNLMLNLEGLPLTALALANEKVDFQGIFS